MHNPLVVSPRKPSGGVFRIVSEAPRSRINVNDPASELLRDFTRNSPLTLHAALGVQEATDVLYSSGVAFAAVTNRNEELVGIVSLKDLVGPQPMSIASQRGGAIVDIEVRDVMHRLSSLPFITQSQLRGLKVRELIDLFNDIHGDYLLVTEENSPENGERVVRGLFSADEISHRLGVRLNQYSVPESFADIVHAVRGQAG